MQQVQINEQILDRARAARQARIKLAREDPNTFVELVMRDEFTGGPIAQADCHVEWQHAAGTYDRLVLFAHVESGKTTQIAVARIIWELGNNPNMRIAIVANTYHQAEQRIRAVSEYIKNNEVVQQVFPDLKPADPWTHTHITVESDVVSKDPSLQACGVHGNILGARLDLIILDDILDYENTLTQRQREDMWNWYHSTLAGRLTHHGRVLAIGTAWHPKDIYHRWEKQPGWHVMRFPVENEKGETMWPERWPKDRIDMKRMELGPLEFARQMLCKARDDKESRFQQDWIDACMELGKGMPMLVDMEGILPEGWDGEEDAEAVEALGRLLGGGRFYTGVDLAIQRAQQSDETVMFTIFVGPDGKRRVCEVKGGKWTGPEIVDRIIDVHQRFNSIVIVENNAAQDFIIQFARERDIAIPIVPFTTGKNKAHPEFGVESLAAEICAQKWIIPNENGVVDPQVAMWIEEMLYYDPRGHTGDRLMASWFAREIARRASRKRRGVGVRIVG